MSRGFSGVPGNIQAMMKQAQKMQEQLEKLQEHAVELTAEGSAGGGMVGVVANAKSQILSVRIAKEVVNPDDIEMLQDLITAAANDALGKAQESLKAEMSKVTGGVSVPGLF